MYKQIRKAERALSRIDPVLARLIDEHGHCTLYDDDSLLHRPRYHVLVWAIINQQLSVRAAHSIEQKLMQQTAADAFTVEALDALRDDQLSACGLSRQKIRYLRSLNACVRNGSLDLENIHHADDAGVAGILTALPGIGPWTVDMFLMFSLGRLDVLPLGDLALRKSLAMHYGLPDPADVAAFHAIAEAWRPWRTVSSWYLWAAVD